RYRYFPSLQQCWRRTQAVLLSGEELTQRVKLIRKKIRLESARTVAGACRIVERGQDRRCPLLAVLRIDQRSKRAVPQGVPTPILPPADHPDDSRHRVEKHDAEPFARARHHEHIRKPEIVRQLFLWHQTREPDLFRDPTFYRQRLQPRAIIAISHDKINGIRM